MNEEFYSIGRGSLNINGKFYCGLDYQITDFMRSLEEENKQLKENYECILKQRDDITKNATQQMESLIDEKNKYKSLYENEKDHTDTLKRIIKKIEYVVVNEELGETIDGTPYYLVNDLIGEKILDLLKEIK